MSKVYSIPVGVCVGRPGGGTYMSGKDVPSRDIAAFGPEKVEQMIELGRLVVRRPPETPEVVERTGRTGRVSPSPWDFDPEVLDGVEVDELNILIMEIDDRIEVFDTAEKATHWLTQDYEGEG